MRHLIAAMLLLAGPAVRAGAAKAQAPERLPKLGRPPAIDGTLEDPLWRRAPSFTAFRTLHPEAGKAPSVRTEARLAFDDSTVYVAIRALDQDPARLRPARSPDDIGSSDWVAFCLDSQGDGLGAFCFLVSPGGARVASMLDGNGSPIARRAFRWTVATQRDSGGYTATMAIPLAQLPYDPGPHLEMAFKVARFIAARGEESDFPEILPSRPHVAQLHRIQLSGLLASRQPDDGYIADLQNALRTKLSRRAQQQYVTLAGRVAGWEGGASVLDYLVLPARALHAADRPFHFPVRLETGRVAAVFDGLEHLPGRPLGDLDRFLTRTASQSLIVIRSDTVVYEKYFNGYVRDSMTTSFSVAKSFACTLVGIAIDRGLIHGVEDPITDYLPELARRDTLFRRIRIADLLHMTSGLRYVEDAPPHDNDYTYLDPDLRRAALEQTEIKDPPGVHWLYNNYNPLLVGMILERATGQSVTALLQDWIWNPLGMEYDASWSLDSEAHGFEKMESGLNARAIDFAKLGALALHRGRWGGQQVVSAAWMDAATQPRTDPTGFYSDEAYFGTGGHYYGYFWWGTRRANGPSDFFALGNKGEFIYCSPQKRLVIVRTGMRFGISSSAWVRLFRAFADRFDS